jgi:hypothetical protein
VTWRCSLIELSGLVPGRCCKAQEVTAGLKKPEKTGLMVFGPD